MRQPLRYAMQMRRVCGQPVRDIVGPGRAAWRFGGEHNVKRQIRQRLEQLRAAAGREHDVEIGMRERRTQKTELKVARQGRQRPDPQRRHCVAAALQDRHEFFARAENPVRVVERDAANLGQFQPTAHPVEQGMAKPRLQRLDLDGQGRLRQVQRLGGAGQIALTGHGAEIAQMVVVQRVHTLRI